MDTVIFLIREMITSVALSACLCVIECEKINYLMLRQFI